jgi:amino-acid N-acetyltransferase
MSGVRVEPSPSLEAAMQLLRETNLPSVDLTEPMLEHFFYVEFDAALIGLIGLEMYSPDALLRSLVVAAAWRASGLGSMLLAHAESHARTKDVSSVYLLTNTAEDFFTRRGYLDADREHAPAAIRRTREFASLCPTSSAFMVKRL